MRTDFRWLEDKLSLTWRVYPGRSFLLLAPHGCDMEAVARQARRYCGQSFVPPEPAKNLRPVVVEITVDTVSCSDHFVGQLGRKLEEQLPGAASSPPERYPADQLEALIGRTQELGAYLVLIITRFHAFARIVDDHLLSVLSVMRTLEHSSQLTTLTVSPSGYEALRRTLSQQVPFVNSAYGDNHDIAVMTPLTRPEFAAAAIEAGLEPKEAHRLYQMAGGPDIVYRTLIQEARSAPDNLIARTCRRLDDRLEPFFDSFIDPRLPAHDELRLRLATAQLAPAQAAHLECQEGSDFLIDKTPQGRVIPKGPILARQLARCQEGLWSEFGRALACVAERRLSEASALAKHLDRAAPHLDVFASLVEVLGSLHSGEGEGLLEIDWRHIAKTAARLLDEDLPIGSSRQWLAFLLKCSRTVTASVDKDARGGARLDILAARAAEPDAREAFHFAVTTFLARVRRSGAPGARVRAAGSIPESILQAIAASLDLNPLRTPKTLPALDYQRFFGNLGEYRPPAEGAKLDLTHLLVIVPALLAARYGGGEVQLSDPAFVKPLHGKLVARLRNANAHTYAEMTDSECKYFFSLCGIFLRDAAALWQDLAGGPLTFPPEPSEDDLAAVLAGATSAHGRLC